MLFLVILDLKLLCLLEEYYALSWLALIPTEAFEIKLLCFWPFNFDSAKLARIYDFSTSITFFLDCLSESEFRPSINLNSFYGVPLSLFSN
jgi:hypothetical protein